MSQWGWQWCPEIPRKAERFTKEAWEQMVCLLVSPTSMWIQAPCEIWAPRAQRECRLLTPPSIAISCPSSNGHHTAVGAVFFQLCGSHCTYACVHACVGVPICTSPHASVHAALMLAEPKERPCLLPFPTWRLNVASGSRLHKGNLL